MEQRKRLIELLKNSPHLNTLYGCEWEESADWLLAKGVIVPPCKVGDTLYVLDDFVWNCDCEECEHYEEGWYDSPSECRKTRSCRKAPECIELVERTVTYKDILQYMSWDDFGKTVFTSREEAEREIERRKK